MKLILIHKNSARKHTDHVEAFGVNPMARSYDLNPTKQRLSTAAVGGKGLISD